MALSTCCMSCLMFCSSSIFFDLAARKESRSRRRRARSLDCSLCSDCSLVSSASVSLILASVRLASCLHTRHCSCKSESLYSAFWITGVTLAVSLSCINRSKCCRASSKACSASFNCCFPHSNSASFSCSNNTSRSTSWISGCISGFLAASSGITARSLSSWRMLPSSLQSRANCMGVLPAPSFCSRRARFLCSNWMHSAFPPTDAACRAVWFILSKACTSAWKSRSFATTRTCPRAAAQIRAVRASSVRSSGSAPFASKASATSAKPLSAATCKGVRPPAATDCQFTLDASNNSTT
mmetsp:Transcript_38105/g.77896  ORF Transcript_38105/g.77896 Transcript_38105/m.77896 type:complete len:297 (+) Transcript_38105:428-1318(+)